MSYIAGIVGAFGKSEASSIIERMAACMAYRDDRAAGKEGAEIDCCFQDAASPNCFLANSTSTFIDKANRTAIALDGEIYGNLDTSDSPLGNLSVQWKKQGRDFPRRINGAYTAALWDDTQKTLVLVRDHIGCRSLYYAPLKDGIVFASTAAAIIASGLIKPELDPESIDAYFGMKALSPPRTLFKNIFALRAGHILLWENGKKRKTSEHDYWRLHEISVDRQTSKDDLVTELRTTITDSVAIRQQAGGNYCALVSGGIDTSAVVSILSTLPETKKPLHGLSIAFEEIAYSDAGLQDCIVKSLGVQQRERILTPDAFADTLTRAVSFLDSPVNDAALVGMYAAFGMAREDGYDIVFDGEGPDELFPAGNTQGELGIAPLLKLPHPLRRLHFGPLATSIPLGDSNADKIRRMCARLAMPDDERQLTWRPLFHTNARRQLLSPAYSTGIDPYGIGKGYLAQSTLDDPLNRYQYGLIKTFLADDLLYKNERMASAHNITNRTPLVDFRLVELAVRIPSRHQIEKPTPSTDGIKLLYKEALRGIVPDEILDRKKERGFSQPTRVWYSGALKDFLHDTILGSRATARGIFDTHFLQRLFDEHVNGEANHDAFLTSVLIFDLWMDFYAKRQPHPATPLNGPIR